jgi:hypothetical protein
MAKKGFVAAFEGTIAHLRKTYPDQWPEDQVEKLVDEAKAAARANMADAETFYLTAWKSVQETGYMP